jgi:hypothetical protein
LYFGGGNCLGRFLPSTSSMAYIMPLKPQQREWYSLPIGWGFLGTNIHPGHVHWLVQTDILSSRQLTHPGLKQL